MKKAIVSIIAIMFFVFPVMVNASEADILGDMLNDGHNKLQEAFTTEENVINTELLNDISGYDQFTYETDSLVDGVIVSLADYAPSISVSVLSSSIKITGVDVVLIISVLVGAVTLALISRRNTVKAN